MGQRFAQQHSGESNGSRRTVDKSLKKSRGNIQEVSAITATSNLEWIVNSGHMRVTNKINVMKHDIPFGLGCRLNIGSAFLTYWRWLQIMLVILIRMWKNNSWSIHEISRRFNTCKIWCKHISLPFVFNSSGISHGDMLHLRTKTGWRRLIMKMLYYLHKWMMNICKLKQIWHMMNACKLKKIVAWWFPIVVHCFYAT